MHELKEREVFRKMKVNENVIEYIDVIAIASAVLVYFTSELELVSTIVEGVSHAYFYK